MLTRRDIPLILTEAGLSSGCRLIVHSSLRRIGAIDGGAETLLDGLLDTVGRDGLLVMPTFTYARQSQIPFFDAGETPARTGALAELFRSRSGTIRSSHPTHSVAAQGDGAADLVAGHPDSGAFGIDSPLDRLARAAGMVLLIGVTHQANSMIHIGETRAGIRRFPWGMAAPPTARIRTHTGRIINHQLDCTAGCSIAFNAIEGMLRERRSIIDVKLGDAPCQLMSAIDVIEVVAALTSDRPDALFCTRGACTSCRLGREHAMAQRLITHAGMER